MKISIHPRLSIHEIGKRDNQEDYLWPDNPNEENNNLFILCDGMGGHEKGEVASRLVCLTIPHYLRLSMSLGFDDLNDKDFLNCLDRAYLELDREAGDDDLRKMGTTITLLYIGKKGVIALHMGDSRIYHIRPNLGFLYQSRDHSLAFDLFQAGEISYEEMLNYPQKNIVTRAMTPGMDNRMRPDIIHITDIQPGDYFYMCSDGMLEQMSNDELVTLLSSEKTDEEKRLQLIAATANNLDNHSAWLIHIKDVIKEDGDELLINEEPTSRCNALNLLPPSVTNEKEDDEDDVVIVQEPPEKVSVMSRLLKALSFNKKMKK